MRINVLFVLFLSFIGDVFSQIGPMMLFRGVPGPMVPGRFPVNGFAPRFGAFPPGFGGAPGMQTGFMGPPGTQPGFQGPIAQRVPSVPGFQMMPSGSMAGTPFPGSGQVNQMTNFVIPSPQFNGVASLFGSPGGTMADTSIRQTPTIPQFPQADSFPMIPAQNGGSNSASSSVSISPMPAPTPNLPPRGFSGTIVIPQQQPGLSAEPSGMRLTPPFDFGTNSGLFGQQDQFQGILADTNDQFQQGMTGLPTQSQASIMGPSISESFKTRFQPLPQNVENFRQQLQTGRAGTGVDAAFPMVPSERSAFSIQFQNNEPVRAIPAESSQSANRVIQGSNTSMNAPLGQAFSNQFQFTNITSLQSRAPFNVQPVFGLKDFSDVNPMNSQISSQQAHFQVPSNSDPQSRLQTSITSQDLRLTDPKVHPLEKIQVTSNVDRAPVSTHFNSSNRMPDTPQVSPPHTFINLLSSPSDFSFFADQSRKDLKSNTNLVDSPSIDPNQRVIFSMDSKGSAVRLEQVGSTSQNTVEGSGISQAAASVPKGGNNAQSFSFTVSGNNNPVKVEPPSPPNVGLIGPFQTGNTQGNPNAALAGGRDNTASSAA